MSLKKYINAPIGQVIPSKNVRTHFDAADIAALAETMKRIGIEHPLHVRQDGDKYLVTDGERRYRAALLANLKTLPVIVEDKQLTEPDIIERQLIADCRECLHPLDKAKAIERLIKEAAWTVSQAASRLALSAGQVSKLLTLLKLPHSIRDRIGKDVSITAGYELAGVSDAAQQAELAERLSRGELTRDGVAAARKATKARGEKPAVSPLFRVTAALGAGRSITVSGPALDLESLITWLEELLTKARKVRPQGITLSTFIRLLKEQAK